MAKADKQGVIKSGIRSSTRHQKSGSSAKTVSPKSASAHPLIYLEGLVFGRLIAFRIYNHNPTKVQIFFTPDTEKSAITIELHVAGLKPTFSRKKKKTDFYLFIKKVGFSLPA